VWALGIGVGAFVFQFLRILRLMRLAKLLRVVRAGKILARLESQMAIDYSHLRLSKFVIIVLMVSHWCEQTLFLHIHIPCCMAH
jgi:hypothetical protein